VIHTENPAPGTRANIYVNKWASFFDVPATIEHDGYAIYVEDNTGWDAITLYCWGDSEVFGGWPGAQVTGTEKIDGKTYKYFDTGADNAGKTINLILNNNNGGSQLENFDVLKSVVLNKNYFFSFSSDNVEAIEVEQPYYIYLADNSEWDDIALYAWGDAEVFGGWPGAQTTGKTVTVNGITYKQFELPAEAIGKNLNLIFNNNNNGVQAKDFSQFTPEAHDYYLMCDGAATVEVDPKTGEPIGGAVAPEPGAIIYIDNQTSWKLFAHYWEEGGASTQWPGQEFTESSEIDGVNYQYIVTDKKFEGKTVGIIFHNDGSETERVQTSVILDKDRYYRLTTEGLEEVSL
ncbi:MAG: starch-binding protein, partial [Bacteroidales bacterium]|nr:starch-binding protein [Bacteroidales bacterium]